MVLRSVKHAVNNSRVARGLVHGPNSLNATFIRQGRISVSLSKLARNLRNGHPARSGGRDAGAFCEVPHDAMRMTVDRGDR